MSNFIIITETLSPHFLRTASAANFSATVLNSAISRLSLGSCSRSIWNESIDNEWWSRVIRCPELGIYAFRTFSPLQQGDPTMTKGHLDDHELCNNQFRWWPSLSSVTDYHSSRSLTTDWPGRSIYHFSPPSTLVRCIPSWSRRTNGWRSGECVTVISVEAAVGPKV